MNKNKNIYSYPRALKLYLYILLFNNIKIFNLSEKCTWRVPKLCLDNVNFDTIS